MKLSIKNSGDHSIRAVHDDNVTETSIAPGDTLETDDDNKILHLREHGDIQPVSGVPGQETA